MSKDPNEKSVTVTTKVTKDKDIAVEGAKPKPGDPDFGIEEGSKPDNTLPTPPTEPDNTLPTPPTGPDQSLPPEHPGEPTQPIGPDGPPPGVATLPVPPGTPTHPITGEPEVPDQSLPPAPDQGLPAFVADTRTIAEQLAEGPLTPEIAERLAKEEEE